MPILTETIPENCVFYENTPNDPLNPFLKMVDHINTLKGTEIYLASEARDIYGNPRPDLLAVYIEPSATTSLSLTTVRLSHEAQVLEAAYTGSLDLKRLKFACQWGPSDQRRVWAFAYEQQAKKDAERATREDINPIYRVGSNRTDAQIREGFRLDAQEAQERARGILAHLSPLNEQDVDRLVKQVVYRELYLYQSLHS